MPCLHASLLLDCSWKASLGRSGSGGRECSWGRCPQGGNICSHPSYRVTITRRRVRVPCLFPAHGAQHQFLPVLWQEKPQSACSCATFLGTVETVLLGHCCHSWQALRGVGQLGQNQVGLCIAAFLSVHRVVTLSGNVYISCLFFPI